MSRKLPRSFSLGIDLPAGSVFEYARVIVMRPPFSPEHVGGLGVECKTDRGIGIAPLPDQVLAEFQGPPSVTISIPEALEGDSNA